MKKKAVSLYIIKLVAFMLLAALPFGVYFGYVQNLPAQRQATIMGTADYKIELLKNTAGPRLILVGGSSSPYATNCEYLSGSLGINTINVGATAYLGIEFYLSMLEKHMQTGDTIVIGPEHAMLMNAVHYSTVWSALENNKNVWEIIPPSYIPGLAKEYHRYAELKLDSYSTYIPETHVFRHPDFGPLGDVVTQRGAILEQGYNTQDPISLSPDIIKNSVINLLNSFYKKAITKNVAVLFVFAPVNNLAITSTAEETAAFAQKIKDEVDIPILMSLETSIMDFKYFYDSNNHLTTEGALIYSAELAKALAQKLKQTV